MDGPSCMTAYTSLKLNPEFDPNEVTRLFIPKDTIGTGHLLHVPICLKAIGKDRTRRYATANDFSQDLRCFLEGRPIQARPFSQFEKAWAWCKRNRPLSISMFLFMFSPCGGMFGSTAMWMRSQQIAASAFLRSRISQGRRANANLEKKFGGIERAE